ncbi:hypothetical protein GLOTRDRAFT_99434 [Gloeophyllum trabeum ATCC 11539]|uniref:Uncharacterized protein n=1 Tax=Gloeophyllum trabeum (strain ATCC 11539 / FP-39264 / Madison 617) TaxID=670483 RepID=S7QDT1_GLOTA|nr:uncharacterized protein GLOTRDRAFT_99434 [Gloeophyllum trabeum ATCC 11539]EPQ57512.1 hypothetical protein GLOTRDRAFT_99434 [Gloeophyllum trabeum ATCC 11539]
MATDGVSRTLTFWGLVGAVMTALKLKEHWNDYQELSQEEGRIALGSPPAYDESVPAINQLDTDIPAARPKRRRSKQFCMCCGLNCGIFWKAFGIVLGIFVLWNGVKLIIWAMTPAPTGLENMPVYSTSLGCMAPAANLLYNSTSKLTYILPVDSDDQEHTLDIRGGAVGTLVLAPYPAEAREQSAIKYEISIRADDEALFEFVQVNPAADGSKFTMKSPIIALMPLEHRKSCMRYDMTVFIPQSLKSVEIKTSAPTHIKFADVPETVILDELNIRMFSMSAVTGENMLLPNMNIRAKDYKLEVYAGWIVGDVPIVESTSLSTWRGNGVLNARVQPVDVQPGYDEDDDVPEFPTAKLNTHTGSGRTDITYLQPRIHRPIHSKHESSSNGELYLTYKDSGFSGPVNVKAKNFSLRNVQGGMGSGQTMDDRWVGDKEGSDKLTVKSDLGWVGLYF